VDRAWEIVTAGPESAEKTVLLLPGGMISARSYAELMAEPALAKTRLLAVTLPGNAGAPPLEDVSIDASAHALAEFASRSGVDVVVGFSNGATVAYEMVVSGGFTGPVVLLGISLSARDESAFFRGMIRLCSVLGTLPIAFLKKVAGSLIPRSVALNAGTSSKRISRGTTQAIFAEHCVSTSVGCIGMTTPPGDCVRRVCRRGWYTPRRPAMVD
jgi:pimeloyl-ACP methyl ester carboxylesterase